MTDHDDLSPQIGGQAPLTGREPEISGARRRGVEIRINLDTAKLRRALESLNQSLDNLPPTGDLARFHPLNTGRLAPSRRLIDVIQQAAEDERRIVRIETVMGLSHNDSEELYRRMRARVSEHCGTIPDRFMDIWPDAWGCFDHQMMLGVFDEGIWWDRVLELFATAQMRRSGFEQIVRRTIDQAFRETDEDVRLDMLQRAVDLAERIERDEVYPRLNDPTRDDEEENNPDDSE